jgi:hypothetical protein
MTPQASERFKPLLGMARLARGRVDGLAQFGDTPHAFLASLAPLLAFPIVGAALMLTTDGPIRALATLFATVVAQVAPAVLSHALARAWGRERQWLRYATAFNWCQWALPLAAMALLIVQQFAIQLGLPEAAADQLLLVGLAAYGLWLNWLLARHGLNLSRGRAAGLVALTNLGTIVLAIGPRLVVLALEVGGPASQ